MIYQRFKDRRGVLVKGPKEDGIAPGKKHEK
jgi:hypothetical protein